MYNVKMRCFRVTIFAVEMQQLVNICVCVCVCAPARGRVHLRA